MKISRTKISQPMVACHYISYTVQKFYISSGNNTWHAVTFPILVRNLTLILHLVKDTWHAVAFPILFIYIRFCWWMCHYISMLFRNLTFTWDFLGQHAVTFLMLLKIWYLHKIHSCFPMWKYQGVYNKNENRRNTSGGSRLMERG